MRARIISEIKDGYYIRQEKEVSFYIEVKVWYGWKRYGNIQGVDFVIVPKKFNTYEEAEIFLIDLLFKKANKVIINNNEYKRNN